MYRSPSPFAPPPENQYHPQPYTPASGGSIVPGSTTYTTSTGSDGRVIYHPFKAVPASYQTPNGVVSGIQWVPAEATQILPAGAQPANTEFAASWNRGHLGKDDQKALTEWQRDEERRRRKEEKDSSKRLREQGMGQTRVDPDLELRRARERDAQSIVARERRKSFNAGTGSSPAGTYAFPSTASGNAAYAASGGAGYPSSPYSGYGDRPAATLGGTGYPIGVGAGAATYARDRKYSSGAGGFSDLERQFGDLDLDRNKEYVRERERKTSGLGRPRKYSTSEAGGERARAISGNLGTRPDAFNTSDPYGQTAGPYGSIAKSYSSASGNHYQAAGSREYYNASPNMRSSPNMRAASPNIRAGEAPYGATPASGYPGSNYSSSPARGNTDPFPRSTTPFGSAGSAAQAYPRGHVMEGQVMPRSRASSPMPGGLAAMGPPAGIGSSYVSGSVAFPPVGASPRMPGAVAFPSEPAQLAAPEGFSRPVNAAHPYTPFDIMKIQDMERFWDETPRMPAVLLPHDVYEEDWYRLMEDIALAWAGKLPVPELRGGRPPKREALVADLIDLWNTSFLLVRGVELVLYKGKERRSGPHAGVVDRDLPYYDDRDGYSTSASDDTEDSDADYDAPPGPYDVYGRMHTGQLSDIHEIGRQRREAKAAARAERKRRRREKRLRRKEMIRERKYSLYCTCVNQGGPGGASHGISRYPGMQGGSGGYGPGGSTGGRY